MAGKKFNSFVDKRCGLLTVNSIHSDEIVGGRRVVKYNCTCECGNNCVVRHSNLLESHTHSTRSCGCLRVVNSKEVNTKHGGRYKNEYIIWCGIKSRCTNPNSKLFPNYGGNSVTVCDRWLNSFENFLEDMGERPSKDASINRIKGSKTYSKETCEWASKTKQCYDQKMRVCNTSGRTGVCFDKESAKWLAYISYKNKQIKLGRFVTFELAVKAREYAEIFYYGELKQECY